MNLKIVQNKYVNALLLLMLGSAIIHMVILVLVAAKTGNLYLLNYFNILDIDLLFAAAFNTAVGNVLAMAVAVAMYVIILKNNR